MTSPEDEAAVRGLIGEYYAAYGRGDLDKVMALWHPSAPGVRGPRIVLERAFGTETYSFSNLAIAAVKADLSRGTARVTADVVVRRVPPGDARKERWIRNLSFLQRDGIWKVWRDEPAAWDLGLKVTSAQTDEEREALLAAEPELVNDDLIRAVETGAMRRFVARDPAGALGLYHFAEQLARRTNNRPALARVLLSTGHFHQLQQNWPSALESFEQARSVSTTLDDQPGVGLALYSMGLLHQQRLDWPSALESFQKARDVFAGLGEKPQLALCETNIGSALYARNQPQETLTCAERARSRLLRDVLGISASRIARGLSPQERDQERGLSAELVSLSTQIEKEKGRATPDRERLATLEIELSGTRRARELLRSTLYAAHPILKVQRGRADPVPFGEAKALLAETGAAALEYLVAADRVLAIAIARPPRQPPQSSHRLLPLSVPDMPAVVVRTVEIRAADLAARIHSFRTLIEQKSPEVGLQGRALYELLVKPVERNLSGSTRLVIIPDGVLWALPFEALKPAAGRFLLEDRAISYAPSLSAFVWATRLAAARQGDPRKPPSVLALGSAIPGKALLERFAQTRPELTLDPMPAAQREARSVALLYGPAKGLCYTGADARKDRARSQAGSRTQFHAAVDGVLSDAGPMYGELVLAPPSAERTNSTADDGAVTVAELLDWDLPVEEVVLSRLRSETGSQTTGEGTIGLSWALYVAGCPTVILSRWRAESPASPRLMLELHRALKGATVPLTAPRAAADALRRATLRLMRDARYRHPYYWAGFFVMGGG